MSHLIGGQEPRRNIHEELALSPHIEPEITSHRLHQSLSPTANTVTKLFSDILNGLAHMEKLGVVLPQLRRTDIVQHADGSWAIGNKGRFIHDPEGLQTNLKEAALIFTRILEVAAPADRPTALNLLCDMQHTPASLLLKKYQALFTEQGA